MLLDLSILGTEARLRGIGRYVADLGSGLTRTLEAHDPLRVLGIERIHWSGAAEVTQDLEAAIARLTGGARRAQAHAAWAYRLRLGMARAVRALAPDLLHTGHPNATPLGRLSCPRVTTCHDLIPLRFPQHYLDWRDGYRPGREWLDHRRYHSANHVIAVSETTANDLVTLLGVPANRITVVYNGVDLSRWSPEPLATDLMVRQRHGLARKNYLLFVGACDWRKNYSGMLTALARVRRRAGQAELVLAWAAKLAADDIRAVRRMTRDLGIDKAVTFLGYVPDPELCALYRGAVAHLFVSRAEGFGYPAVEAMSAGCPVITSDRSSTAEIAGDGAIQVDPENPDAIADAIIAVSRDVSERKRWSIAGAARARQFSLERMAAGTLAVYRDLIGRSR